jgi:hypothetical protein
MELREHVLPCACLVSSRGECQVEIDVPYTEYQAAQQVVKSTMWPCHTVMDLVGDVVLHLIFRLSYRCVSEAESCHGIIFRSEWCRESEK